MTLRLRPARWPDDLATVRALLQAYADSLPFDLEFQGFREELASLPGAYAAPAGELLLACTEAGAVGCVALRPLAADASGEAVCEMKRLFVLPRARGLGAGRALVAAIVGRARELGYRRMRLDTAPGMDAAQALYVEAGFRRIEAYCHNPIPCSLFFELDLGQSALRLR